VIRLALIMLGILVGALCLGAIGGLLVGYRLRIISQRKYEFRETQPNVTGNYSDEHAN
jgi:hypothetical protein